MSLGRFYLWSKFRLWGERSPKSALNTHPPHQEKRTPDERTKSWKRLSWAGRHRSTLVESGEQFVSISDWKGWIFPELPELSFDHSYLEHIFKLNTSWMRINKLWYSLQTPREIHFEMVEADLRSAGSVKIGKRSNPRILKYANSPICYTIKIQTNIVTILSP